MSHTRLLYHIVFATRERRPAITPRHKRELFAYILGIVNNKKCYLHRINGITEHIHMLVEIHPAIAVSDFVKTVKQATSIWLQHHEGFPMFDSWAEGYYSVTVSPNDVGSVRQYIINQETHHAVYNLDKEIEMLMGSR